MMYMYSTVRGRRSGLVVRVLNSGLRGLMSNPCAQEHCTVMCSLTHRKK